MQHNSHNQHINQTTNHQYIKDLSEFFSYFYFLESDEPNHPALPLLQECFQFVKKYEEQLNNTEANLETSKDLFIFFAEKYSSLHKQNSDSQSTVAVYLSYVPQILAAPNFNQGDLIKNLLKDIKTNPHFSRWKFNPYKDQDEIHDFLMTSLTMKDRFNQFLSFNQDEDLKTTIIKDIEKFIEDGKNIYLSDPTNSSLKNLTITSLELNEPGQLTFIIAKDTETIINKATPILYLFKEKNQYTNAHLAFKNDEGGLQIIEIKITPKQSEKIFAAYKIFDDRLNHENEKQRLTKEIEDLKKQTPIFISWWNDEDSIQRRAKIEKKEKNLASLKYSLSTTLEENKTNFHLAIVHGILGITKNDQAYADSRLSMIQLQAYFKRAYIETKLKNHKSKMLEMLKNHIQDKFKQTILMDHFDETLASLNAEIQKNKTLKIKQTQLNDIKVKLTNLNIAFSQGKNSTPFFQKQAHISHQKKDTASPLNSQPNQFERIINESINKLVYYLTDCEKQFLDDANNLLDKNPEFDEEDIFNQLVKKYKIDWADLAVLLKNEANDAIKNESDKLILQNKTFAKNNQHQQESYHAAIGKELEKLHIQFQNELKLAEQFFVSLTQDELLLWLKQPEFTSADATNFEEIKNLHHDIILQYQNAIRSLKDNIHHDPIEEINRQITIISEIKKNIDELNPLNEKIEHMKARYHEHISNKIQLLGNALQAGKAEYSHNNNKQFLELENNFKEIIKQPNFAALSAWEEIFLKFKIESNKNFSPIVQDITHTSSPLEFTSAHLYAKKADEDEVNELINKINDKINWFISIDSVWEPLNKIYQHPDLNPHQKLIAMEQILIDFYWDKERFNKEKFFGLLNYGDFRNFLTSKDGLHLPFRYGEACLLPSHPDKKLAPPNIRVIAKAQKELLAIYQKSKGYDNDTTINLINLSHLNQLNEANKKEIIELAELTNQPSIAKLENENVFIICSKDKSGKWLLTSHSVIDINHPNYNLFHQLCFDKKAKNYTAKINEIKKLIPTHQFSDEKPNTLVLRFKNFFDKDLNKVILIGNDKNNFDNFDQIDDPKIQAVCLRLIIKNMKNLNILTEVNDSRLLSPQYLENDKKDYSFIYVYQSLKIALSSYNLKTKRYPIIDKLISQAEEIRGNNMTQEAKFNDLNQKISNIVSELKNTIDIEEKAMNRIMSFFNPKSNLLKALEKFQQDMAKDFPPELSVTNSRNKYT